MKLRSSTNHSDFGKESEAKDGNDDGSHQYHLVNQIVKQFLCKRCNQIFSRSDSYQRHIRSAHLKSDKKYICVICGLSSPRLDNVKKHLKKIHDLENGKVNVKDFIIESPLHMENAEDVENGEVFGSAVARLEDSRGFREIRKTPYSHGHW